MKATMTEKRLLLKVGRQFNPTEMFSSSENLLSSSVKGDLLQKKHTQKTRSGRAM